MEAPRIERAVDSGVARRFLDHMRTVAARVLSEVTLTVPDVNMVFTLNDMFTVVPTLTAFFMALERDGEPGLDCVSEALGPFVEHYMTTARPEAERLAPITLHHLHRGLIESFDGPLVHIDPGRPPMIQYRLDKRPLGWMPVCRMQGVVLIKTFLFITGSTLPEGRMLDRLLGIGRAGKEYLRLDRLSTFVATDALECGPLREGLLQAHCDALLHNYAGLTVRGRCAEPTQGCAEELARCLRPAGSARSPCTM